MASGPSDSLGRIQNKKRKLTAKPHGKTMSIFGEFGSTLRDLLTKSFVHESSRHSSTATAQNECREGVKKPVTKTVVEVSLMYEAGTGEGPQMQGSSDFVEISTKTSRESIRVKSVVEDFGSTLKDFLTPSFRHKSPEQQSTNADQSDCKEEEKTQETKTGIEVVQVDDTSSVTSVDSLRIQGPASNLTEIGPKAIQESIKVELDFFDLLLIARSFYTKSSEVSSRSCSLTCSVRQGSACDPHLFNLYATPHSVKDPRPTIAYRRMRSNCSSVSPPPLPPTLLIISVWLPNTAPGDIY